MIELRNVSLSYRQQKETVQVLNDVSLKVINGGSLAIVGASGCGKTSLLHIMAGLKPVSGGEVLFKEKPLTKPRSEISMIFQNLGLFPWKTVKENIILPLRLQHRSISNEKFQELVEQMQLAEHLKRYPSQLSGGQQQRVAIARAVINDAELILMDEPFSALDILNRERLQRFMTDIFKTKKLTSVIVTHNIDEALSVGEDIAVFHSDAGCITEVIENKRYREKGYLESAEGFAKRRYIRELLL